MTHYSDGYFFMRRGNVDRANKLSLKLNNLITEAKSKHMRNLANADSKRLWQAVKGNRTTGHDSICENIGNTDEFNKYFADSNRRGLQPPTDN